MKRILLLLGATLLLSGCIRVENDLTINSDGSAVVKERFMMNKQMLAMANTTQDPFADVKKESRKDGSVVSDYETDEMKGVESVLKIENLDTHDWNKTPKNKNMKSLNADGKFVSIKKGFLKTVYKVDSKFDSTEKIDGNAQLDTMKARGMDINNIVNFLYVIHTPVKATSHNAAKVQDDGLTYIWQIKFDEPVSIQLEFAVYNFVNISLLIVLLLVFAGAAVYLLSKKD